MRSCFFLTSLILVGLCVGCGVGPAVQSPVVPVGQAKQIGHAHGGQSPITGAVIQLWQVNTSVDGGVGTPMLTGTVTSSDGSGNATNSNANIGNAFNALPAGEFVLTGMYTCPEGDALVYLTASGGNPGLAAGTNNPQAQMVTALGSCTNARDNIPFINISEQTTVGTVAALYAFMSGYNAIGASPAHRADLNASFPLVNEYVDIQAGTAPGPSLPPGYDASTGYLNLLANVLAACVDSTGGVYNDGTPCGNLFLYSTKTSSNPPTDVTAAALSVRNNYSTSPGNVGTLATPQAPFQPASPVSPSNGWSLPIVQIPPAPSISPNGGTFGSPQTVTLADTDSSAAIYYTLDGSTPTAVSTLYRGTFSLGMTTTVKAIAIDSGAVSATSSASFILTGNFPNVSLSPAFVPQGSTAPVTVTATSTADGSTATFSVSGAAGGSFSPSSCVVTNGMCSVSYVPSGSLASGTYAGGLVVNFSAVSTYSATSTSSSLTVRAAVTGVAESLQISFTGTGGSYPGQSPVGQLVLGSDGNFYGVTKSGGAHNDGVVFQLTSSGMYTVLYAFTGGSDGANPMAGLVEGDDGNFYGTTYAGGINQNGTIFQITPSGVLTTLYLFQGGTTDGAKPQAPLMQAMSSGLYNGTQGSSYPDGYFYGTTTQGGANGTGTIFNVSAVGAYNVGFSWGAAGTYGVLSVAGQLQEDNGGIFTTCYCNQGFAVSPLNGDGSLDTGTVSTGSSAADELIEGPGKYKYVTTEYGGANNAGIVFQFIQDQVSNSYSLDGVNGGKYPLGALVMATDGNFYGTASAAGAHNGGTAFSVMSAGTFTTLYPFGGTSTDGTAPAATLLQGADGNLYGSTTTGGSGGFGTIYKLTPNVALPGPVSLTAPATVAPGGAFTLGYSVANAYSDTVERCFATNTAGDTTGWTGIKTGSPTATNVALTAPSAAGTYQYSLTCGGTESGFATIHVQ